MMQLIARRLYLPGGDHDDLAQEARMGLVDAVRIWDPARGVPFSNFAWLCATREARNAVQAARTAKHHLLTTATPLDVADGSAKDALTAGELPFDHHANPRRHQRVRNTGAARAHGGDDDPVAKTLGREQLRALIARTRTLSPLERRALALATNDHSHREITATLHFRARAASSESRSRPERTPRHAGRHPTNLAVFAYGASVTTEANRGAAAGENPVTAMRLDADDIEAVALRVAELVREQTAAATRYVDAAELARILGVERDWVYARASRLGAVRLGDGPKARLRFDIERVRATLAGAGPGKQPPRDEPPRRRRGRPRRHAGAVGVPLIQGRSSR
jgi:RNA polymerase sporulation-specific sigma factor